MLLVPQKVNVDRPSPALAHLFTEKYTLLKMLNVEILLPVLDSRPWNLVKDTRLVQIPGISLPRISAPYTSTEALCVTYTSFAYLTDTVSHT